MVKPPTRYIYISPVNQVFAANSDNQLLRILVLVPGRSEIEQMTGRVMASEEEDELAKQFSGQGLGLGQLQGQDYGKPHVFLSQNSNIC